MSSAFLALHRQDSIACQRAFDRIAQGASTIPNHELRRLFNYLGAVTAPETLDLILKQFSPANFNTDITKDDAMNLYAIWLKMVSVSEPPSLELLDKRTVVPTDENNGNDASNDLQGGPDSPSSSQKLRAASSPLSPSSSKSRHWTDKIASFLGNTNVLVLTITRTSVLMIFTLVHLFSVFFRDADATLRCGSIGIGLDCGHTGLITLDLLIEFYAGDYRQKIKRALEEKHQEEAKSMLLSTSTSNNNNNNNSTTNSSKDNQDVELLRREKSSSIVASDTNNSFAGGATMEQHQQQNLSGPFSLSSPNSNNNNTNVKRMSSASYGSINNSSTTGESSSSKLSKSSFFDELIVGIPIFFSNYKNVLGLISLLPLDLFLCAGDAVVAATVLNHIRLISVVRNYINPNPPTPVPLTTLFADIYYFWMPLWMMTYTFIIFASIFAIIFIIFRSFNGDTRAPQLNFLTAFYFVIQNLTTVGFYDSEYLFGTAETWFAVVLVLVGMVANATVIGSLVALIQLGNATIVRSDKIRESHAVLHYFSIPRLLQLEILGFQEHVLFSDVVSAFHSDTESFPTAMKDAMILQHRFDVLKQIDPFTQASSDELFFLSKELVTACFKPEEYLSCCSEPHHGIRILLFGLVDRLDARGRYIKTLRSGDCFGIDGILSGKDEEFNHKALAYCDLLVISYDDFHNILEAMPKFRSWVVPALREVERQMMMQQQQEEQDNDDKLMANQNSNSNNSKNENENGTTAVEMASSPRRNSNNNNKKQGGSVGNNVDDEGSSGGNNANNASQTNATTAKVLRSPVSMIDTTGGNLSMVHDLRSELRVFRRGLQTLSVAPALNK